MSLDEKLHRVAGWAGWMAGLIGLVALVSEIAGADVLRSLRPEVPAMKASVALCLVLGGGALWFQRRGPLGRIGSGLAAAMLALAVASILENAFGVSLGFEHLLVRGQPGSGRMSLHTSLTLALMAAALLSLRQRRHRARWPVSAWLANLVIAVAAAALLAIAFKSGTNFARPLRLGTHAAMALLILGVGTVLARPEDRHVRIVFATSAIGVLARRLLFGAALLPLLLSGLLAVTLHYQLTGVADGVILLAVALVLSGFAIAFFSVNAAVGIDDRREEAERQRGLLVARLEEQAAQLQQMVAMRTRELHEANINLRAVAESNARLALVAQHTTNGVVIADAAGRIEWVNGAFEQMTGYTLDEIRGRDSILLLQGPGTDPTAAADLRHAFAAGEPRKVEILNYTKTGRPFWQVEDIQPVRDSSGRAINFISLQTDVTEQRAATQRLHALNQRLRLATHAAALGVWEYDAVAQRSYWDDRTLEIYGVRRENFGGTEADWLRRLHPDDVERAQTAFRGILADKNEYEHEFRIIRASDDAVRHIQSRAIVQRDADGRLLRVTGTERDITAEREAIERTEALNERLRLALRSSNYGVWELDAATNRLVWDDRMFELYDLRREEFDGSRDIWRSCLHPDDWLMIKELTRKVISGELPAYDTEFRIPRPDGTVRYIEAHAYLQRDHDGRAVRFVGLNRDITAEKQMQEALALAEQRWQLAIEGSNDSVWDWNVETGFMFHDARWAPMLGYEPAEIDNTVDGWKRLVHPEDLADDEAALREHFAQRTPFYSRELRMRAKHGEWKWILRRGKAVSRTADGRPRRLAGTHSDVTARRQLEERLRQVEELSDQVGRLALIGGWEIDLVTSHLKWSTALHRIHEVDENFVPSIETALAFYGPEARDLFRAALHEARTNGAPIDLELQLTTARGRAIWVRVLGEAELHHGKAVRLHGALQDITAPHGSEDARRQLEMQLFQAQKMETLGTLAGGIAHDFNNLLTGIIGYHELAADALPEDHPARQCLAEARHASLRARELVEQILTFGRQPAGVEHGPLDLSLVLEEARRFLRATLPATINIELRFAPDCGHVLGDATQIHQVLLNLGSNAAHAMRQHGGTLTITLAPAEVGPELAASLGGIATGAYLCLSVRDTGHGMDEPTRRRIFDPFFTTKNTREGTGLGLAVVHGIVRAHRGAIDVESAPGAGATFHIYLPTAASQDTPDETDPSSSPRGQGELVCVVDDEEVVGSCTKLVLENKGYRAAVFDSADQCVANFENTLADCAVLLTDQTMPGMQGTELAAALRKRRPNLPVVIMSGYFSKISPAALDELGQVELLAKPFTTDELAQAVHRALHSAAPGE